MNAHPSAGDTCDLSSGWRDKERRFFGIPDEEELGASMMIYTRMVRPRLVAMLSILLLPKSILCLSAWSPLASFYFLPSNLPNLPNPKRYFRCSWVVVLTRLGPSQSSQSNKFLLSLDSIGGTTDTHDQTEGSILLYGPYLRRTRRRFHPPDIRMIVHGYLGGASVGTV